MARSLASKTNVNPPDSDYPYGRTRDNDGSGNGTPVNERLIGDIIQFFEHMMNQAGVSHNELPDNADSGFQYFEALLKKFVSNDNNYGLKVKVVEIGDWNMDSTSFVDVAHGLSLSKIRSVHGVIRNDGDSSYSPIPFMDISVGGNDTDLTINNITASAITLLRKSGGVFDGTSYDQTGYNRGWLTIHYVD